MKRENIIRWKEWKVHAKDFLVEETPMFFLF